MAKGKKTGGRIAGVSINKRTQLVEDTAARLKIDPFEILCLFAKGDWKALGYDNECYFMEKADGSVKMGYRIPPDLRLEAAKAASKYLYSPKQPVNPTTGDTGLIINVVDYTKKVIE